MKVTIDECFELVMEEVLFGFAHRDALMTHQHWIHVAHTTQGGVVTTAATHHISTTSAVVLCEGRETWQLAIPSHIE